MPHDIANRHIAALNQAFENQKAATRADPYPSYKARMDRLNRFKKMLATYEDRIINAINTDFGNRAVQETRAAEIMPAHLALSMARRKLRSWMKPRRKRTDPMFWPGHGRIMPQPLGVVGIIAPWNYPGQLSFCPMITAIAAGNSVIIRPSELSPAFGDLLKKAVEAFFKPTEIAVILGDIDVSQALTSLPFDHIVFTGSTSVGRKVAVAAAENLVPVTLELGGKSPAIIDPSANFEKAMKRIIKGKLFSAGQTCIAPDYLIVPKGQVKTAAETAMRIARELYPTAIKNPDATEIISDRHFARLNTLVSDARDSGATVHTANDPAGKVMPLVVLTDVTDDMTVMQDEIFGPILPIISAKSPDDVAQIVQSRPRPLALYWFGNDANTRDAILQNVHAGGVTINDILLQIVQHNMPFGGVGDSGMGNYHGKDGFDRLSHLKSVFTQRRISFSDLLAPPYTKRDDWIARLSVWWASK